jgi:predicted unusual protein kinase regulating ubiquinone biosynthesis (AarF/ABC1/UbiB family)
MDAYITRGEANLYTAEKTNQRESKYAVARRDFDEALRLVLEMGLANLTTGLPSNPKIAAVCGLRIAQCYAREGNETKALEHYVGWEILRSNVEHEFVRELADEVKSEIDSLSKNFTISAKDQRKWDYAENVAKMRRWLLTQALRQTKNYTEAAKLIGVQRATLYQWQEDSRTQPRRARINADGNSRSRKGA